MKIMASRLWHWTEAQTVLGLAASGWIYAF